jgi:hypothetical protein
VGAAATVLRGVPGRISRAHSGTLEGETCAKFAIGMSTVAPFLCMPIQLSLPRRYSSEMIFSSPRVTSPFHIDINLFGFRKLRPIPLPCATPSTQGPFQSMRCPTFERKSATWTFRNILHFPAGNEDIPTGTGALLDFGATPGF